ncbi:MAG: YciI family protein [Formivibrio sp.]|nr:YciI family protein [Formivibrio sp.]
MFLILLNYVKPLAVIEQHLASHREFLQRHYAQGTLLLSGRKEPRNGGVILARADSLAEVEALIREDPFHRAGAAEYQIIEFVPTMAAEALRDLAGLV